MSRLACLGGKPVTKCLPGRTKRMGEPEDIRFSNFRWHEDRETGDIVLFMTACPGNRPRTPDCGCPMHSYRYDIHLPP